MHWLQLHAFAALGAQAAQISVIIFCAVVANGVACEKPACDEGPHFADRDGGLDDGRACGIETWSPEGIARGRACANDGQLDVSHGNGRY